MPSPESLTTEAPLTGRHLQQHGDPSRAGMQSRRPIPSPLQTSRSVSDSPSNPRSPSSASPLSPNSEARLRAPKPARKAPSNPAIDEIRNAVTRDFLREEEARRNHPPAASRNEPAPLTTAETQPSPPSSPTMLSSSPTAGTRAEPHSIAPRTASIDSTNSTASSASISRTANGAQAYRVTPEPSGPQDVASLITAAGTPEAALQKLIHEKNQAASHNAQLWRLVEKQRAMILGLNKDLEKSLKDKERYRRKLKESLPPSQSVPVLTAVSQLDEDLSREESRSRAADEKVSAIPEGLREMSVDSRKASDTSEMVPLDAGRSDTPQDTSNLPPVTPVAASRPQLVNEDGHDSAHAESKRIEAESRLEGRPNVPAILKQAETPPISPKGQDPLTVVPVSRQQLHQKSASISSANATSPPASAKSFSSPKSQASRKAPPAPLNLASPAKPEHETAPADVTQMEDSDSEYEDDPDSARMEQSLRGRRKTREDDDREREALVRQEEEHRSQSKKEKKSKSVPPVDAPELPPDAVAMARAEPATAALPLEHARKTSETTYHAEHDPLAMIRQRARSDAAGKLPKSNTAPSLMSPGLPMSPRPGDRPMNSPMPRAPARGMNAMPMSPKPGPAGSGGFPLSPRAPRHAIPLPPQTPLSLASPHLARVEGYQQQSVPQSQSQPQMSSLGSQLKPTPSSSPEHERPSTSSEPNSFSSGEVVYKGLVTEQYPDLLLPPNALPSIYVKTSSSRMRPSRQSYIAPRPEDNPVFHLAVHARSDNKQLWRVEKTYTSLSQLDQQIKNVSGFRDRIPERSLFAGHAPAKIDARRLALDSFFNHMLEFVMDERSATVVCRFLSTDAMGAGDGGDYFPGPNDFRPDTPVTKLRQYREGYLTKRGKNFGGWKARYFVLDGPNLKYFDDRGGALLGAIKLQSAQIGKQSNSSNAHEDEDNQFRHAFLVLEPKKKDSSSHVRHVLCAESDEERDLWVDALLQYVDYRDDEADAAVKGGGVQMAATKPEISAPRAPRTQRSMNDLMSTSQGKTSSQAGLDAVHAVGYGDTVAGEAPIIGPPTSRNAESPSSMQDSSSAGTSDHAVANHPTISAPTNMQVISNAVDWGMKAPATPHSKEKKRSIFAGFRGRSSSELASNDKTAVPAVQDHYATSGPRAVFGVPIGDAVEFARPADVDTELPAVVYRCIEFLLAKSAIAEEGIFRLSGSNTVIKGLKDQFNTQGDVDLIGDGKYHDIHAVASLLKLYLRELPSSILTRELHLEFLQCLEMHGQEKVLALNVLVNKLPRANWALLDALSSFLLSVVSNAEVNKMNVRNVGIVFAPTLNVPAPLISSFVEDQSVIFGPPIDPDFAPAPRPQKASAPPPAPSDLRSPRKQMFSDLPTPQTATFQSFPHHLSANNADDRDTGLAPLHPTYANYSVAPQGDGAYSSLNDALRSPGMYPQHGDSSGGATPAPPRDVKAQRRQSAMLGFGLGGGGPQKKTSMSKLREQEGASF